MSPDPPGVDTATKRLAELADRLGRCADLDEVVAGALEGLDEQFGYAHSLLLLADEPHERLYTLAGRGYEHESVGAEVGFGEGLIGMVAAGARPLRVGNLGSMLAYGRSVRRSFEAVGTPAPHQELPLPGLADAQSQVVVPAMALGRLVGVLAVEDTEPLAFDESDEAILTVVARLLASAIAIDWARAQDPDLDTAEVAEEPEHGRRSPGRAVVRFFAADGSTFLDGEYLIRGVAGRILWSLLGQHRATGRVDFTNRELRLDPSLDLPPYRDNLESRLLLLRRRLDERDAPIAIERTARGCFRLAVRCELVLEER